MGIRTVVGRVCVVGGVVGRSCCWNYGRQFETGSKSRKMVRKYRNEWYVCMYVCCCCCCCCCYYCYCVVIGRFVDTIRIGLRNCSKIPKRTVSMCVCMYVCMYVCCCCCCYCCYYCYCVIIGRFVASLVWRGDNIDCVWGGGGVCVYVVFVFVFVYVGVCVCVWVKRKEKKRNERREELECVGGVKRRKITRNWSVRTGRFVPIDIDNK